MTQDGRMGAEAILVSASILLGSGAVSLTLANVFDGGVVVASPGIVISVFAAFLFGIMIVTRERATAGARDAEVEA